MDQLNVHDVCPLSIIKVVDVRDSYSSSQSKNILKTNKNDEKSIITFSIL